MPYVERNAEGDIVATYRWPHTSREWLPPNAPEIIAYDTPKVLPKRAIQRGESTTPLVDKLPVAPGANYLTVYAVEAKNVTQGDTFLVYGEAHGNPNQNQQIELAWVTGIVTSTSLTGAEIATIARERGRDLLKAKKHDDIRIGVYVADKDYPSLFFRYKMRAVNLKPGGDLLISPTQGKIGYLQP